MKRPLRGVTRGLLALSMLVSMIGLCPCDNAAGMAMDDCCQPADLSIGGACCDSASGPTPLVSPVSALVSLSAPASLSPLAIEPWPAVSPGSQAAPVRPVVARTILRT